MSLGRWETIRCNGPMEQTTGFKFVLHDKRTGLIRGGGQTRRECMEQAREYEADEKRHR